MAGQLGTNTNKVPMNVDRSSYDYSKTMVSENQKTIKHSLLGVCTIVPGLKTKSFPEPPLLISPSIQVRLLETHRYDGRIAILKTTPIITYYSIPVIFADQLTIGMPRIAGTVSSTR